MCIISGLFASFLFSFNFASIRSSNAVNKLWLQSWSLLTDRWDDLVAPLICRLLCGFIFDTLNQRILWFCIGPFDSNVDGILLYSCPHKCLPPQATQAAVEADRECNAFDSLDHMKQSLCRCALSPLYQLQLCSHLCQHAHAHTRFHLRACECPAEANICEDTNRGGCRLHSSQNDRCKINPHNNLQSNGATRWSQLSVNNDHDCYQISLTAIDDRMLAKLKWSKQTRYDAHNNLNLNTKCICSFISSSPMVASAPVDKQSTSLHSIRGRL